MSNRDWRARLAYFVRGYDEIIPRPLAFWEVAKVISMVLLWLFILCIIASTALSVWPIYVESKKTYQQYKQNAEADRQKASDEIADSCSIVFFSRESVASCISEKVYSYQEKDNKDRDLQAQQDMALWAWWMFVASMMSVVVSFIAMVMLWQSLRQTRRAISNDREVGHAQVRAYIAIEMEGAAKIVPGKKPTAHFKLVNTGQSPARKVSYVAAILPMKHPLPDNCGDIIGFEEGAKLSSLTLPANGKFYGDAAADFPLSREDFEALLNNGEERIYIFVRAVYMDVFDGWRETKLCAYFIFNRLPDAGTPVRRRWAIETEISHVLNDAT